MKRLLYLLLAAGCVTVLVLSPYGINKTLAKRQRLENATTTYMTSQSYSAAAKNALLTSRNNFISSRDFEIAYSDITRLVQVLNNVMTVTVSSVNTADPSQHFVAGLAWDENSPSQAVIISLTVDDTVSALQIINKMELPLYSIAVTEPNIVNITFLTGGEVSE